MLKLDNDKLLKSTGLSFDTIENLFLFVSNSVEWLESHNKNYNKEQYRRISDLKDICDCIEVEWEV